LINVDREIDGYSDGKAKGKLGKVLKGTIRRGKWRGQQACII
jgi:hypothetical protein